MDARIAIVTKAIHQNEDHSATIGTMLDYLVILHERALDAAERAKYEREIRYYTQRRAQLHRDRDELRRQLSRLKQGTE